MTIRSAKDIGQLVRKRRKEMNMTQKESAAIIGVGIRFLSELENGKSSLEIDKVIRVMLYMGIDLEAKERK